MTAEPAVIPAILLNLVYLALASMTVLLIVQQKRVETMGAVEAAGHAIQGFTAMQASLALLIA